MIEVVQIKNPSEQAIAHQIREEVFVKEQHVPREEEYDAYEESATHYLAFYEQTPCGTARWRFTDFGIKLERFAVRKDFRAKKIGKAIILKILEDIQKLPENQSKNIYLHAQIQVVGFYEKFGFRKVGEMFQECDIWHYKMIKSVE